MTGIIILAAGSSSRLGKPKQNLIYKGQTLLQKAIDTAYSSVCKPVIVVLGANEQLIGPTIANKPVNIIHNPEWGEGMASSIRFGIIELKKIEPQVTSVILMICDQPFVSTSLLDQLVQPIPGKGIAACAYNNTTGVPAFFSAEYFNELLLLQGHEGAKKLLLKYPDAITIVPFPLGNIDIDTVEDFEKLNTKSL